MCEAHSVLCTACLVYFIVRFLTGIRPQPLTPLHFVPCTSNIVSKAFSCQESLIEKLTLSMCSVHTVGLLEQYVAVLTVYSCFLLLTRCVVAE